MHISYRKYLSVLSVKHQQTFGEEKKVKETEKYVYVYKSNVIEVAIYRMVVSKTSIKLVRDYLTSLWSESFAYITLVLIQNQCNKLCIAAAFSLSNRTAPRSPIKSRSAFSN